MSKPELRVYLELGELQRQFAAFLSSPIPARGYVPFDGMYSIVVEIAPGLSIEGVIDSALKTVPDVEPGILAVERQFGVLELHSRDPQALRNAGQAILAKLEAKADDQLKPKLLFSDLIEDITDQHAVIINRSKQASMVLPGQSLLLMEVVPALFGAYLANEAERAFPENTLVECRLIGASGRIYVSGDSATLKKTQAHLEKAIKAVRGRND